MRFGIAMILAAGLFLGAAARKDDAALQGVWQLTSGEANGKTILDVQLKGGKLVIEGDHYSVTLAEVGTLTGTQKLGSTGEFKTIDITDDNGPNKGHTCLGIYELKGNEFRVIFAVPGKPRPTRFTTTPDSGQWMHVWKRVNG